MRKHHYHKWIKRIMMAFAAFIAIFALSSCTNSFCTNQDRANQLFAAVGNIFNDSVDVTEEDNYGDHKTGQLTYSIDTQNTNRESLYSSMQSSGYNLPSKTFNAFMDEKAKNFADENVSLFMDGTLDEIETEDLAWNVAWHVGIFAGISTDEDGDLYVSEVWTNYNEWYDEALEKYGILVVPTENYVSVFQSYVESFVSSTACITPVSDVFKQSGSSIYIQGKTWGEAFRDYGFLEGLFVYPFSWIVYQISTSIPNSNGWSLILAIVVVTIIARIFTIISTLLQSKQSAKQQLIQPKLNALQAKYPNANYDKEQKQALAMEQAKIMKEAKIHPFIPMIFLILQFPLFICVWSALQGSAVLASESWLGLSLTTTVSTCFTSFGSTKGAVTGICIFIFMTLANILSSCTGMWFNNWRTAKFGAANQPTDGSPNPAKTMKYVTYFMMVIIIIMGWSLPAGMGIYWFTGAVISILQSLLNEFFQKRHRHKMLSMTGDGTNLATLRRSAHHQGTQNKKNSEKKSKSDKPLWR